MTANAASEAQRAPTLEPGTVVGGRFTVERAASHDPIGSVLAARDQKTSKPIALRVIAPHLVRDEAAAQALRAECRTAASLAHRNIVGTYGVGTDPSGAFFVACEWIDGVPLSQLVAARRDEGGRLSVRGAYNVVAHVCKALTFAHAKISHGALRPGVVWVSRSGRVKVGDFGVGRAIVRTSGAAALGAQEQACLAPEVKAGKEPSVASDIFGVGAILYEMLTSLSPADGFVPPSQAHPEATQAMDEVLLRCLAPDPAGRFESPDEVRRALLPLVADAPAAADDELGVDIDLDVDLASMSPPSSEASQAPARAPAAPTVPSEGDRPQVGQRVSLDQSFRGPAGPAPPGTPAAQPSPGPGGEQAAGEVAEVDLSSVLAKITENDAPRWMVVKGNLDHGPFSGRELVELILKGEMAPDNTLLNMDTGERKPLSEWPDFTEFLEQYELKKRQEEEKVALARSVQVEKRSNVAKIVVAAAVIGVLALAGGIFVLTRQAAEDEGDEAGADLAALYEKGEIDISGSAGILPDPKPSRRRRGGGSRRRRTGGGGGSSYEEAMNRAMDLGSAGGEQRLNSGQVAGVMNRHINKFFSCVSQELRRGGSLGQVQIDLAIAGNGKVLGASARQGSSQFKSCIERKARQVTFPSFSAPRMGARYSFSVD
jgi:serine/threonine-protein kinase